MNVTILFAVAVFTLLYGIEGASINPCPDVEEIVYRLEDQCDIKFDRALTQAFLKNIPPGVIKNLDDVNQFAAEGCKYVVPGNSTCCFDSLDKDGLVYYYTNCYKK